MSLLAEFRVLLSCVAPGSNMKSSVANYSVVVMMVDGGGTTWNSSHDHELGLCSAVWQLMRLLHRSLRVFSGAGTCIVLACCRHVDVLPAWLVSMPCQVCFARAGGCVHFRCVPRVLI
jgi:hypothetical protein